MSFLGGPVSQSRKPFAEILPDGRKRLTRWIKATTTGTLPIELGGTGFTVASADPWPTVGTPTGWTGLLLTYIQMDDDMKGFPQGAADNQPLVRLIYEQISATAETLVGNPTVVKNQYGYLEVTYEWVQFSSNAFVPQVVGTTTAAAPWAVCVLRDEDAPDDGTLRHIKRTYVGGGELSDISNIRFGGKVIVRTLKYLNQVPPTPTGYTLVGPGIDFINGLPVYTYEFVNGGGGGGAGTGGVISTSTEYHQSSDQGTTGVSIRTIEYITDLSVVVNPISTPSGYTLIEVGFKDDTGYRLWTARYAKGVGLVVDETTIQNSGGLVIYHRVALDTAPTTPSATIGGTVTLFDSQKRNADGYIIYDYQWAEGYGEISRNFVNAQGGAVSFNPSTPTSFIGPVQCVIRYMTATSVTTDPTTGPSSFVRIGIDFVIQNGYKVWTVTWAYGAGIVQNETLIQSNSALVIYHRVALGNIGGVATTGVAATDVLTQTGHGYSDGYEVYFNALVGGAGLSIYTNYFVRDKTTDTFKLAATSGGTAIDFTTDITSGSTMVINPLTTPGSTIGGTVKLFENLIRTSDGYSIYERRWAEGAGNARIETRAEPDGALIYAVTDYNVAATTPAYPGSGTAYLVSLEQEPRNGYYQNTAIYKKPPATQTRWQTIEWQKPGIASFTSTQLTLSPPATRTLLASMAVTYSTTQDTTVPWEVQAYASFVESYTPTASGIPVNAQRGLAGYLSGATSVSGSASNYNGVLCDTYSAVLVSSIPSSRPIGATTLRVDNEPYITATDGTTVVYRITKVSYTF